MHRPQAGEYAPFYEKYVSLVASENIVATLAAQVKETAAMLSGVPEERGGFRYAPDKWSIKEVLGHLIDTERIMAYRALRIGRGDATPLAGFEQDDYVRNSGSDRLKLAALIEEFSTVRRATVALFENFPHEAWTRRGIANNNPVSARALAWIIAGHELHHRRILAEKYLA